MKGCFGNLMNFRAIPPFLFLNGLFILIMGTGMLGLYFSRLPGSGWLSVIWVVWILANYLFLIRIKVCRYCSHYGRTCPMGWGRLISFFMAKGERAGFSNQKWAILYFLSFAVFPFLAMVISLIFSWNPVELLLLILFLLSGFFLYKMTRALCCTHCDMKPLCLLTKVSSLTGMSLRDKNELEG